MREKLKAIYIPALIVLLFVVLAVASTEENGNGTNGGGYDTTPARVYSDNEAVNAAMQRQGNSVRETIIDVGERGLATAGLGDVDWFGDDRDTAEEAGRRAAQRANLFLLRGTERRIMYFVYNGRNAYIENFGHDGYLDYITEVITMLTIELLGEPLEVYQ